MSFSTHSIPHRIHPAYDPGPLDGPPSRVLDTIDRFIAQAVEWETVLTKLRDTLTTRIRAHAALVGTGIPDVFQQDTQAGLDAALVQLHTGVAPYEGVIPVLVPIAGKPGLDATQQSLTGLRELRESFVAQQLVDPNAIGRYRLTRGKHVHEGRLLKPGDVIALSLTQYTAFKDKFEPADDPAPAASRTTKPDPVLRHTTDVVMQKRAGRRRTH